MLMVLEDFNEIKQPNTIEHICTTTWNSMRRMNIQNNFIKRVFFCFVTYEQRFLMGTVQITSIAIAVFWQWYTIPGLEHSLMYAFLDF